MAQAAVMSYGSDFLEALQPVIDSAPKNGAFITSCVCHGCPWYSFLQFILKSPWFMGG